MCSMRKLTMPMIFTVVQEIKNVLEAEIVEILNTGTMKQLLKLSGIGKKRAEHIMQVSSS